MLLCPVHHPRCNLGSPVASTKKYQQFSLSKSIILELCVQGPLVQPPCQTGHVCQSACGRSVRVAPRSGPSVSQVPCSVASTLLHHHVLVVPHDHLAVLVVQHGERGQAGRNAGQTRNFVRVVKFQQALEGQKRTKGGLLGHIWKILTNRYVSRG